MYCKKCGTYNSNNSLRCKKCGDYLVNQYLDANSDIQDKNLADVDDANRELSNNKKKQDEEKASKNNKSSKNKNSNKRNHRGFNSHKNSRSNNKKNNDKKDKGRDKNRNSSRKRDVVVEKNSGCFSKIIISFLILIVFILFIVCSGLGLYICQDKVVKVPDVVNLTRDDAIKVLQDNELNYKITYKKTDNSDSIDIVMEQKEPAGKYILKNKSVTITVGTSDKDNDDDTSDNTYENSLKVMNLVGKTKEEAIKLLKSNKINYTIEEVTSDEDNGIVIRQNPLDGTTVSKNTIVTLYVSNGQGDKTSDNANSDLNDDTLDSNQ